MIGIVDYGLGNVKAFQNVYKRVNIKCELIDSPKKILGAEKLILPGVGSFDHAMSLLNKSGLREALDQSVLVMNKPVIGICVGMQMMANNSDEGSSDGLGWIPGTVRKFFWNDSNLKSTYPQPHMGWNSLEVKKKNKLTEDLDLEKGFYFLHSYYFESANTETTIAETAYGINFECIVNKGNIFGIQFHPEKSHNNGITLLKNFHNYKHAES